MAYGLNPHDYVENGPTAMVLREQATPSSARHWRALDAKRRMAMVERALSAANDPGIDGFPIAL